MGVDAIVNGETAPPPRQEKIDSLLAQQPSAAAFFGVREGQVGFTPIESLPKVMDMENQRPKDQWWRTLTPIADLLAQPGPDTESAAASVAIADERRRG